MDKDIQYFAGAKWVYLNGNFTEEELSVIIDEIKKNNKEFKEVQDVNKE